MSFLKKSAVFAALILVPSLLHAFTMHGTTFVTKLAHINGILYVGLADKPPQCTEEPWSGFSLKIPNSHTAFKDVEAFLLSAMSTDTKVNVWYTVGSDRRCSTEGSLMDLAGVGFDR